MASEKKRQYMKEWRLRNRASLRIYNREWLENNKEANTPKAAIRNARWYAKKKAEKLAISGPPKARLPKKITMPRVLLSPEECHARKLARTTKWRMDNKDKVLEYRRKYAKDKPEVVAKFNRAFREKNRKKRAELQLLYRTEHPEKVKLSRQNWLKSRPGISAAYGAKYRAVKDRSTPAWADLKKIRKIYREAHALRLATGNCYAVDHIIPLNSPIVCGLHVHNNLQILTRLDNAKKGNKFEIETTIFTI
ncbi:hypothetical protein [Undibacterium sp.]|uniref:hypothetical protein n=1 Tax=Undibacterium sp. TaxID=1914977 RepID=UPI0025F753B3|nr:hypothetical protein [Undibacterium sp.]